MRARSSGLVDQRGMMTPALMSTWRSPATVQFSAAGVLERTGVLEDAGEGSNTHQLQVERRESHRANQVYALTTHQLQVERRESHRDNQVYALTTHQLQVERRESHRDNQVYALTTHQLQVERRERES